MTMRVLLWSALFFAITMTGCAAVKPWEREYLADEILQFDSNVLEAEWHIHVQEVLEGSRGGFSSGGGGCGCR